jgi:hypothetical protein
VDEQELIKLLVTLKCLLPVICPAKTPTYLKRVVKEKWNEVNRLRKRRVRWTIGGDKIDVEYDARALDLSILTGLCQLSSYQSNPTQLNLTAAHRLLNYYVSSHPNPHKTIYPSSMALWAWPAPTPATCLDLSRAV